MQRAALLACCSRSILSGEPRAAHLAEYYYRKSLCYYSKGQGCFAPLCDCNLTCSQPYVFTDCERTSLQSAAL